MSKIIGVASSRSVFVDGELLSPHESQKIWNHSPDGFSWGYGGSGPAQLALSLLLLVFGKDEALRRYQLFKADIIAGFKIDEDFEITTDEIREWSSRWVERAKE